MTPEQLAKIEGALQRIYERLLIGCKEHNQFCRCTDALILDIEDDFKDLIRESAPSSEVREAEAEVPMSPDRAFEAARDALYDELLDGRTPRRAEQITYRIVAVIDARIEARAAARKQS